MSSAVVRTYSGGGRGEILFVEKEKRISGHFFAFSGQKKLWGSCWFVMQKFFYTLRRRGRGGGETVLTKRPNKNGSLF